MFKWDEWVIDIKKRIAPEVVSTIDSAHGTLYVLYDDEAGDYYITSENNLIPYDKYWFDEN